MIYLLLFLNLVLLIACYQMSEHIKDIKKQTNQNISYINTIINYVKGIDEKCDNIEIKAIDNNTRINEIGDGIGAVKDFTVAFSSLKNMMAQYLKNNFKEIIDESNQKNDSNIG